MRLNKKDLAVMDWLIEGDKFSSISSISKKKLDEKIVLGSKDRESINDRTGSDYTKAFEVLHKNVDNMEKTSQAIYDHNNVDEQDRIAKAVIPLIDEMLNKYMSEMEDMEKEFSSAYIPAFAKNVANIINNWILHINKLETMVNQHYNLNIKGRDIVGRFITDVYTPATNYTNMISELIKKGNAQVNDKGVFVKFDNIMKSIDEKSLNFFKTVEAEAQAGIKAGSAKLSPKEKMSPSL